MICCCCFHCSWMGESQRGKRKPKGKSARTSCSPSVSCTGVWCGPRVRGHSVVCTSLVSTLAMENFTCLFPFFFSVHHVKSLQTQRSFIYRQRESDSRQAALLSSKIRKRICSISWCRVTRMKTAYCVLFLLYFVNAFYATVKIIYVK